MTITIADLQARVSATGAQETQQQIKAVGEAATQTARALELMAQAAAKQSGGTAQGWVEIFQRGGVQPTAAAMADAAKSMQQTTAAATQAVAPTQAVARAADDLQKGFSLSNTQIIRIGAGLAGIGLGINLLTGVARLVHQAVTDIVDAQLNWERSIRTVSGLYGEVGQRVTALATAQAALPGVLGTQQEFARAAINASALTLRYGLDPRTANQFITTGGRVSYALGMTNEADRARLQEQILGAVTTGAPLPPQYGVYTDPEAVARRLGFRGPQALQAFAPQQLMEARGAIVNEGLTRFTDQAMANQRAALDAVTAAEKNVEQAQTNVQQGIEGGVLNTAVRLFDPTGGFAIGRAQRAGFAGGQAANIAGLGAIDAEQRVLRASERYAQALADSAKAQADAKRTLDEMAHSVEAVGARLLTFEGSLEDITSIARGDILAQAQGGVAARGVSAVPLIGRPTAEIGFQARNTAYQQAWQNYVAQLAQGTGDNAIRANLERLATMQGPGLEAQRGAAQRALEQAGQTEPVQRRMGQAQVREAQVNLATAETQAQLEAITLRQRERYVQLMRDTVDLRRLDIQQQQIGIQATMEVIRAQQAALPAQYAVSNAQYQQTLAGALARQRMARLLQGQDVSGLPSIDQLIQMNVQGQLAGAEAEPAAVRAGRGVELAQRGATAAGLAQALTAGQLRSEELRTDLANLGDLPQQTALELELVQNNRDQLTVQKELREYLKQLVWIMTNQPPTIVPADQADRIAAQAAGLVFGDGGSGTLPAAPTLPGARRGPS